MKQQISVNYQVSSGESLSFRCKRYPKIFHSFFIILGSDFMNLIVKKKKRYYQRKFGNLVSKSESWVPKGRKSGYIFNQNDNKYL